MTDNLTSLMWSKNDVAPVPVECLTSGSTVNWQGALDHVKCLNQKMYLGYNDWRLPNVNELESLVNYEVSYDSGTDNVLSVSSWLKNQGFANASDNYYWTSTSLAEDPGYAWAIRMYAGDMSVIDKKSAFHAWPVRTALTRDLFISGTSVQSSGPINRIITVLVQNTKEESAGITVAIYLDGTAKAFLEQKNIESLGVNEEGSVVFELDVSGIPASSDGNLAIYCVINGEQTVSETTYRNNSQTILCPGAAPGDVKAPLIADGAMQVSTKPLLAWDPAVGASVYDLYLWQDGEAEPSFPVIAGVSTNSIRLQTRLLVSTLYHWRIVAKNNSGQSEGPLWSFTTEACVPGDINADNAIDLRDMIISMQALVRMPGNGIRTGYPSSGADINGNGKIGLQEVIHILQEVAGFR